MSAEDEWPYMSDEEIEAIQRRVSTPGYVPPPEPPLYRRLRQLLSSAAPASTPVTHRVRVDSTWWELLGWECAYRYQAKCRCGWYGDSIKSKVAAEQQAEWHVNARLSHV